MDRCLAVHGFDKPVCDVVVVKDNGDGMTRDGVLYREVLEVAQLTRSVGGYDESCDLMNSPVW